MRKSVGGMWISLAEFPTARVTQLLEHGSGLISIALLDSHLRHGISQLALISSNSESVEYLAIVSATSTSGDLESKAQIGPAKKLYTPIQHSALLDALPPRLRQHFRPPMHRAINVPPETWKALLANVVSLGHLSNGDLNEITDTLNSRLRTIGVRLPEAVAFERDAVATALEVFGGGLARKAYISSSAPIPDAPFIQRLRHRSLKVIEDSMITHDMLSFPGIVALRPVLVGAVQLTTQSGTLTILNANRTTIERTLGVDLVYFNHQFESFVLVQYKRLCGENNPVYRPESDRSLADEIRRMKAFDAGSGHVERSYESYRLVESPFFLKLCRAQVTGDWNGRMLNGMYFPLHLWDLLLESSAAVGPRGGIAVGFDGASRRFSNSTFTRLLSQGWLGTASTATKRISEILEQQLAADRSIVVAIHEPSRTSDLVRDERGRFASPDDESAV